MCKLTRALGSGVVDRPPGVARFTLRSAVHRTMDASLRHAVVARAHVPCTIDCETAHYAGA